MILLLVNLKMVSGPGGWLNLPSDLRSHYHEDHQAKKLFLDILLLKKIQWFILFYFFIVVIPKTMVTSPC